MDTEYLTLSEAAKHAPGKPHSSALWRWCRVGIKSRTGERIRLEHVRAGGRILIRPDALDEFYKAVADADSEYFDQPKSEPTKRPTSTQRKKSIERAAKTLTQAGIA